MEEVCEGQAPVQIRQSSTQQADWDRMDLIAIVAAAAVIFDQIYIMIYLLQVFRNFGYGLTHYVLLLSFRSIFCFQT